MLLQHLSNTMRGIGRYVMEDKNFDEAIENSEYLTMEDQLNTDDELYKKNREAIIKCLTGDIDTGLILFDRLISSNKDKLFLRYNRSIARSDGSLIDLICSVGFEYRFSGNGEKYIKDFEKFKTLLKRTISNLSVKDFPKS